MDTNGNIDMESIYNRQRAAVNSLVTIETQIKDIIQQHTDYDDELIFEALDSNDFDIQAAVQYCHDM